MIYYRPTIKPYIRSNNKNAYEYEGYITEFDNAIGSEIRVFYTLNKKRRDTKLLVDAEYKRLKTQAKTILGNPLLKIIPRPAQQRGLVASGMAGRNHTPEARAAIGRAVRKRHEEGAYAHVKLGRKTDAERKDRSEREAKSMELYKQARRAGIVSVKLPGVIVKPVSVRGGKAK